MIGTAIQSDRFRRPGATQPGGAAAPDRHELMKFSQLVRHMPGRANVKLLHRWTLFGLLDPDGRRILLGAQKSGGVWFASLADLDRFNDQLVPVRPEPVNPRRRDTRRRITPSRQRRALTSLRIAGLLD